MIIQVFAKYAYKYGNISCNNLVKIVKEQKQNQVQQTFCTS